MKRVLLVEDELGVVSFVRKGLTEGGYDVSVALDGETAIQLSKSGSFDIMIIDIMLPGINGLKVCQFIREQNREVGILFLSALSTTDSIVQGFEFEADDYITKPFKFEELLARMKGVLRRSERNGATTSPANAHIYQYADITLDDYSKTVKRSGRQVPLTSTEYRLLLTLIKNPRRVFSRAELLDEVWGVNFETGTNVVDVYVNYLRKKIDKEKSTRLIQTVVGMGYALKDPDEDTD